MRILITGVAGFIGFHLARRLLAQKAWVYGVDNLNQTYPVQLKRDRLAQLATEPNFRFQLLDLGDRLGVTRLFQDQTFDGIIHLATEESQPANGLEPQFWFNSAINGFFNLLEACRHFPPQHLVFASSGSVYGANLKLPFAVSDRTDAPTSLEAATKKTSELIAHVYSYHYQLPITGVRLFTVYGPWGRPDMTYFKFVQAIATGQPIVLHNFGKLRRDLIYIDDVVEALIKLLNQPPQPSESPVPVGRQLVPSKVGGQGGHEQPEAMEAELGGYIEAKYIKGYGPYLYRRYRTPDGKQRSQYLGKQTKAKLISPTIPQAPYKIYNLGSSYPIDLITLIEIIESLLDKRAEKHFLSLPPGTMMATCAEVNDLVQEVGCQPQVQLIEGMQRFIDWYREYVQT